LSLSAKGCNFAGILSEFFSSEIKPLQTLAVSYVTISSRLSTLGFFSMAEKTALKDFLNAFSAF